MKKLLGIALVALMCVFMLSCSNGGGIDKAKEIIRHGFEDIRLKRIFCCYFDGNEQSKRVKEKCGFVPYTINDKTYIPMLEETRKEYVNVMYATERI